MTNQLTARRYDLFLTRSQKLVVAAPLIFFVVFPIVFYIAFHQTGMAEMALKNAPPFFPAFPIVIFIAFGLVYFWHVASLPYRISVTQDQRLVFKSLARSREVRISELISIEPGSLHIQVGITGYVLKHLNGKIRFPGQFTDQYALLWELKRANAALKLQGC